MNQKGKKWYSIHHEQFEAIGGAGISVKLGKHACSRVGSLCLLGDKMIKEKVQNIFDSLYHIVKKITVDFLFLFYI
jgi:hypothetical protein